MAFKWFKKCKPSHYEVYEFKTDLIPNRFNPNIYMQLCISDKVKRSLLYKQCRRESTLSAQLSSARWRYDPVASSSLLVFLRPWPATALSVVPGP